MTATIDQTETAASVSDTAAMSTDFARWRLRAAALLVDVVPGVAVMATASLVGLAMPLNSAWWKVSVAALAAAALLTLLNRVVLPALGGWSMGRALLGLTVSGPDGCRAGVWRLLLRDLAHLLDTASAFVGWLWPLWDSRRRTFADMLLHTEVHRVHSDHRPPNIRWLARIVVSAAALLCIGGAALSFTVVYRNDRASDQTRTAIQQEGPKIVTELLTYDPKSLNEDFARAQSLTSDKYRPRLAKEQDRVRKGSPVVNEYWVVNSAVLSATPNRAAMLLFMQGHRGGEQERFITATVRVAFVRSGDAQWLVEDLVPVTKPKPARGQK